jgi:mitochondrial fission factor
MSFNGASPTHYGFEGDPLMEAYNNAKFSAEISDKMKVPKRISANGYEMDQELLHSNNTASWNYNDKFDMTVPERIVVIGQDQHLGKKFFCFFFLFISNSHHM